MTNRNSPFQQASKSCISVILVGPVIPVDPERLEHLWFDSWVIGNIITEKFHLLWRALFICDHKGFTFHPSSNHHHHHHIIITSSPLSSNQHHLIIMSSPLSSHHHPQSVKITFIIASAGKDCISWKGSQTTERKGEKGDWLSDKVNMQYAPLLHNHKIAWVGQPLRTLCTGGALCTQSTGHIPSLSSFGHTSLEKRCTSWPLKKSPRRGWRTGMTGNTWEG